MTVFNIISVPFRRMIFCGLFPPLFTLLFIDLGKFFFFFAVVPSWLAGLPPPHAHCMMCLASISGVSSHVHRSSSRPPPLAVFFMCLFFLFYYHAPKSVYILSTRGGRGHTRLQCSASCVLHQVQLDLFLSLYTRIPYPHILHTRLHLATSLRIPHLAFNEASFIVTASIDAPFSIHRDTVLQVLSREKW
ncbi:hypothetical protein V8B97DRAFT_228839 [Scleroderma yunnanense]